ncbi:gas vesicle protein [Streptomyces sp. NPDC059215]|uniref:gas vesicle protein GvpO n=1 Tax=Streptomyces sp. NPDC059215 TaxID=3346772 RepID=UPI0036AD3595
MAEGHSSDGVRNMPTSDKHDTESGRHAPRGDDHGRRAGSGGTRKPVKRSAAWAMRCAAGQLEELLGRTPESVSAIKPTEDGWEAYVEVLELERIPETTSVLASYRVTLSARGELLAYEQTRRYTRGQIDRRH